MALDGNLKTWDGAQWIQTQPEIPDSVVAQYYATTWDPGDATWQDDATSEGAQDASINGGPQAVTLSDGSEALGFDGSDDYGLHDVPISGAGLNEWMYEFASEWTTTADVNGYTVLDNNNQLIQFRLNVDANYDPDSGNILFRLRDTNNDAFRASISGGASLNDGNRHDISFVVNDASAADVDIIVDGSTQTLNINYTNAPTAFDSWNQQIAIAALNNAGSISNHANIEFGAIRWHNSAISEQTISDYP